MIAGTLAQRGHEIHSGLDPAVTDALSTLDPSRRDAPTTGDQLHALLHGRPALGLHTDGLATQVAATAITVATT